MVNDIFARRTQWTLAENEWKSTQSKLIDSGVELCDLTVANPTRVNLPWPESDAWRGALNSENNLTYVSDASGLGSARSVIARYLNDQGLDVAADRLILTSSTSEGYNYLFRLLADPGDSVLFPAPSYPLFQFLSDINDVEFKSYALQFLDGWSIDFSSLAKHMDGRTKAVVVVNPNNPTGSYCSNDEYHELSRLCSESSVPIISDDVFWDFPWHDGLDRKSFYNRTDGLTFTLGGLSKLAGLPQMKLAWIAVNGPDPLVQSALSRLDVIADTFLSVNTPVMHALPVWMSRIHERRDRIGTRLSDNLTILRSELQNSPVSILPGEGGWSALLRLPRFIDERQWVMDLLNRYHTVVYPGYFFDFHLTPIIVLSLLADTDSFRHGIRQIHQLILNQC